jgi:FkbM family methyltransferase
MYDIKGYRDKFIEVLKETNNYYDTDIIEFEINNFFIRYHRWLHPFQGDWELREVFTKEKLNNLSKIITDDSIVLDIGAQSGNMSVAYSLFADKVVSFECNPAAYEVLEKNSKLNSNIIPFNYAVSDEEGPLEFHYSDNGFCNGGYATRTEFGIGNTGHTIPIDVWGINLEQFLDENDLIEKRISLIKIDTEGHDKDILKTIINLLNKYKPALITEIYNGLSQSEIIDLIDTIHSFGYRAYDEEINKFNLDDLGKEIKSYKDINPTSGHNLICVAD